MDPKKKKFITFCVIPVSSTIFLILLNLGLTGKMVDWVRYILVFMIAWMLYTGSAVLRGTSFSKQLLFTSAIFALFFVIGLYGMITSMIAGDRPLIEAINGYQMLNLTILCIYMIVVAILSVIAIAFTKSVIKS